MFFYQATLLSMSILVLQQKQFIQAVSLGPVVIPRDGEVGACPVSEIRDAVIDNITAEIKSILNERYSNVTNNVIQNCGAGEWHQVAFLNMSNSSQQCPSAWREYNSNGIRACGRPTSSSGSCPGTLFAANRQYNKVCGKIIGYQVGSPDAFGLQARGHSIDSYYLYGISITHGSPRNHIWSLAGGVTEGHYGGSNCPCSESLSDRVYPPSFVGDNYYCESGNPATTRTFISNHLYSSDPLWDGTQCEGECCSNGKSPPWFSVELPNPTSDDIEVRICSPEGSFDDTPVQLLELYIH